MRALDLGIATLVSVGATVGTLSLVGWLNAPMAEAGQDRTALEPIVVEQAPPPEPPQMPLPRDVPSLSPTEAAASPSPQPEIEPSALQNLPQSHLPSDAVSVLPGLGDGDADLLAGVGGPPLTDEAPPLETAVRPRRRPAPTFPEHARRRGLEGFVVVRLRVDAKGRVTEAVVVSAKPEGVFDEVALQTARRYQFDPARRGGEAVSSTVEQRIVFKLQQ